MDAGSSSSLTLPQQFRQFTISEIHLATRNFDESLVIGHGGFGMVYKGTIINGATHLVAAIKRLDFTSDQGAVEFWNEVQMLSKLWHCHLVSLIGYCNDGQEMILVYEYMPHGTLDDHLHKLQSPLPWVRRLKICIGAACGLDYLHTGTGIKYGVIHRDVKSSNILLDDNWAAKISDFGLSKLGPINQPATYVSTFVKGTFGYLDPDYFATGRLTRKSDVYAFGVVLLEVLSGKKAVDQSLDEEHWGLVNWVPESMKEGRLKQIVDCNIRESILPKCLKKFAKLADWCLHSNPKQRPTMAEVVFSLESVLHLQEKASQTLQPLALRIFGNKVPMLQSWSNGDKSEIGKSKSNGKMHVAKLTGPDTLLESRQLGSASYRSNQRGSRNHSGSPDFIQKEYGLLETREHDQINQSCKDVSEIQQQFPQKGIYKESEDEKNMALVREKFMEAKRLSADINLRQSKQFQDALEVLSSNKDLLLKIFQEPNSSFSLHHHHFIP